MTSKTENPITGVETRTGIQGRGRQRVVSEESEKRPGKVKEFT